jgi:hypothetical protein
LPSAQLGFGFGEEEEGRFGWLAGMEEEMAEPSTDFLDFLGPDTSAIVFTMLHDPADLARASAVSRSWRTFGRYLQFLFCPHTMIMLYTLNLRYILGGQINFHN